ncbi:phosphotransferase family protein [SAR86 cluster bacterium]|uniref:Phosphotransferase family protein n=1 Tax=SAR86 cluster bacterium TaxID=2030880 RepID=A0A9Q8X105_9GAMM|nr:phosphotransferase family protein [SAR86 cluster bacterium]
MSEQFSGTKEVSEKLAFNLEDLNIYLEKKDINIGNILNYEQFKGGQSNPTYLLTSENNKYVLRRKPPGKLLKSAHAVDREYKVLTSLQNTEVPTPKTIHLCEDESVIGTIFYIMEFCDGNIFWDPFASEIDKGRRSLVFDQLNQGISLLHIQDIKTLELEDFGKTGNYIERQVSRWTKQYFDSETEKIDSMHKLIEWLPKRIPKQKYVSIVHGDYRLDNVVFDNNDNNIAILDWELSTIGDPLADFGYHCLLWHIGKIDNDVAKGLGIPNEDEYLNKYLSRTKMQLDSDWEFYIIFSLFKVAGICQGILGRVRDGTAASEFALQMGKRAIEYANLGWEKAKNIS